MSEVGFAFPGLNSLVADLGTVSAKAEAAVSRAVKKTALDIQRDAQTFAPVDTGFLVGSITTAIDGDGLGATIGPTAEYGGYVELGTEAKAPQAFMGPAFDRNAIYLVKAITQAVGL